uniref:Uncharacterized protein n=1 Tax=Strongyloides stercoralis TaxID=6248 RepID=A0AAF5CRA2_STRER
MKPDIIDAIEEDPDVIGNISPDSFDKLDDLRDQSLSEHQKIEKAQQILKSDSGLKDMADNIIRKVSGGSIDMNDNSINPKFGSTNSLTNSISNNPSSSKILSNIRNEFETNYDNIYNTLSSKAKEVADDLMNEIEDKDLSLTELTSNIKSIFDDTSSSIKNEIKSIIPEEINLGDKIKNTLSEDSDFDDEIKDIKSSLSNKIGSIKNENNPEFLVKAKNSTVQEVKNVLRNISITYEQQVESVKKILNSDKDVKGLYEKIEKLFNKTIDQKLKLIRENFEPLYKNVSANITDPDVKLVAETLASVIRNTSLPLSELELKIKTIFENIEPKVSDQLKVLIPKELNLQINFKSKPWTSKLMDKLRSFGNKIKNFFSGNKNKDDNPTAVNVSNHNSTTKQM